jgi:hypothetical protein
MFTDAPFRLGFPPRAGEVLSETSAGVAGFRVWVRRLDVPEAPFAVRFEVRGGKGILRVARPGVLIDPPARAAGVEERLTAPQLRASRFLHVRDGGRERRAHSLSRCEEGVLEALPAGEWTELEAVLDGPNAFLALPRADAEEAGEIHTPISQKLILQDFQRDLRQLVERGRPPASDDEEDVLEAGSVTGEAPLPPRPATFQTLPDAVSPDRPTLPGTAPWPVRPTVPTNRAASPPATSPPASPPPGKFASVQTQRAAAPPRREVVSLPPSKYLPTPQTVPLDAGVFDDVEDVPTPRHVRSPASLPPDGPLFDRAGDARSPDLSREAFVHARSTTLVRYFRRKCAADEARIRELEDRVRALESRLSSRERD